MKQNGSLALFLSFVKIGAFTFGGGYAMIPIIRREIVERRKWVEESEFLDLLTLAQSAPGAISINTSVFVGYRMDGMRGALCAISGIVLPSFLIILLVAVYFTSLREYEAVEAVFKGMRPAVVALIIAPILGLSKGLGVWRSVIAVVTAVVSWYLGVSPMYLIIIGAAAGLIYGFFNKKEIS